MTLLASVLGMLLVFPVAALAQADSSADASFEVAAFRTAIRLGERTAYPEPQPRLYCLTRIQVRQPDHAQGARVDPDPATLEALASDFSGVRPNSACFVERMRAPNDPTSLVVERATGRRGIAIWVALPDTTSPGEHRVQIGYYQAGLSAADWDCVLVRRAPGWIVTKCALIRIS